MINNKTLKRIKYTVKAILITMGIILLINAIVVTFLDNFNIGIIIAAFLAVSIIFIGIYFDSIYKLKGVFYSIVAICLAGFLLLTFIFIYGYKDNVEYNEDAIIVLGSGIHGDKISAQLKARLDKTIEYCNKNINAMIIVSGGKGAQETITEALAMEKYLVENGVDATKIIKEENSFSTYTNLVNSKNILDDYFKNEYKTAIITSDYHIYRAIKTAEKIGLNSSHYHANIEWYNISIKYLRESVAVLKFWLE